MNIPHLYVRTATLLLDEIATLQSKRLAYPGMLKNMPVVIQQYVCQTYNIMKMHKILKRG